MKKVILYIATSLDGYIADKQGDVNWIKGENDATEMQDTFSPFFEGIGTVIMGRRTYQQIVTELSRPMALSGSYHLCLFSQIGGG